MSATRVKLCRTLAASSVLFLGWLGAVRDARATLGGDIASIAANGRSLGAARQVTKLAAGERHELTLPSGIVVHEYVSPSGAVYAITWRGPRMPDLRELLGPYFAQLSGRASSGGHHRMNLAGSDLVVQSIGHRRWFTGRAWAPSLVPPGVKVDASLE